MLWNSGSFIQPVCHYIWPLLHSFHQPGVICVTRSFHLITFSSREDPIRPFTLLIISVFLWMCRIDSQPKPHWFPSWNKASLRPNLNLPVWLSIRGVHDGATVMIPPRFTCQHHFLATVFFFSHLISLRCCGTKSRWRQEMIFSRRSGLTSSRYARVLFLTLKKKKKNQFNQQ